MEWTEGRIKMGWAGQQWKRCGGRKRDGQALWTEVGWTEGKMETGGMEMETEERTGTKRDGHRINRIGTHGIGMDGNVRD